MKFGGAVSGAGRPDGWAEAVRSVRATHGKGASRHLADRFGVTMRTAQRWLKGEQAPTVRGGRRAAVEAAADRNAIAADRLRSADALSVGRVPVVSSKGPDGTRNVGVLRVTDRMRAELDRAAALIEQGRAGEAEAHVSRAIMGGYGEARGGSFDATAGTLSVGEWPDGLGL